MLNDLAKLTKMIPKIRQYDADLEKQNLWWSVVAMVGKVNNQNMEGQLLDSITSTQQQFDRLRFDLIQNMVQRYFDKIKVNLQLKSQAFVDTLNRNLFERTADVGFLATDETLVDFLAKEDFSEQAVTVIQARLDAYVQKYSVYDDVVLVLPNGQVVARLDNRVSLSVTKSPVIAQALSQAGYVEYDLPLDILPNQKIPLTYCQRVVNSTGQVLGVLCLSFKFEDELIHLCQALESDPSAKEGHASENLLLLNAEGQTLFAKQPAKVPQKIPALALDTLECVQINGHLNLAYVTQATGYQGFMGLPLRSVCLLPIEDAFAKHLEQTDAFLDENSALFPSDLNQLNLEINTALLIVVLNGKIISLKNKVKAFLPVLDSFQEIGSEIRQIFANSINHIHQVAHQTLASEISFLAKLAMDIMDRNLYERANDCRWWALNRQFSHVLSGDSIITADSEALSKTLQRVNELYTIYQQIFIFDKHGQVVALSNPKNQDLLGKNIAHYSALKTVLNSSSPQHYQVSHFEPTPMYEGRPTYIYYAAVPREQAGATKNVGGVGVVFDALPEFKAILQDFLPKDAQGQVYPDSFGVFIDAQGVILSVTDNAHGYQVGDQVNWITFMKAGCENGVFEYVIKQQHYLVGYQVSQGYREYKNSDGYHNQVISLVWSPA